VSSVLFFIAALGVIAGAVGVIALRDPFYSVLALVVHLVALAVLFLLLRAEFVAAVQVVVYAGAVMVLYVFVVAYVGGEAESMAERLRGRGAIGSGLRLGGAIAGGALMVELLIALLGTGLEATRDSGAPYAPGPRTYGTPAYIGQLLLTRFLLVFEIASFLLLVAAVGAVVLAGRSGDASEASVSRSGRRRGLDELPGEGPAASPTQLLSGAIGTMAEGVGLRVGRRPS
jgi:NADH-quinone oxidoreductase subunit J